MSSKSYSLTPATFEAHEVEAITGISTVLQREWRRRQIIRMPRTNRKRARWTIDQIGEAAVIRVLTGAGVTIATAMSAASVSVLPLRAAVMSLDAPAMSVLTPRPDHDGPAARYVVVGRHVSEREPVVSRTSALAELEGHGIQAMTVIDLHLLAFDLVRRTPKPFFSIEAAQ